MDSNGQHQAQRMKKKWHVCCQSDVKQTLLHQSSFFFVCVYTCIFFLPPSLTGFPSLRIEKNDLRSVTLLEAKAKVKDIAISRERVTLRDVLHEGIFSFSLSLSHTSFDTGWEFSDEMSIFDIADGFSLG